MCVSVAQPGSDETLMYCVKWRGYPSSNNTWEPLPNLRAANKLVEEFDMAHPM